MKTTLTEMMDHCTPEELDGALRDIEIPLPEDVPLDRIQERALENAGIARPVKKQTRLRKTLLIAAAIVAVAAVLVGCYVADVTEYNRAIEFFELNSFSTEGLTRGEIKRVYRDITTESLSFDKSYEVIENNISADSVAGMDIRIMNNSYTNNALAERYLSGNEQIPARGITYEYKYEEIDSGDDADRITLDNQGRAISFYKFNNMHFSKYVDGENQWTARFEGFGIEGYVTAEDKVLVYGSTADLYREKPAVSHIALIDDSDGSVLWHKELDGEDNSDIVGGAVYHNGGFTLFSLPDWYDRDEKKLTVRTVDMDGMVKLLNRIELEDAAHIGKLTALGDGYFVEIAAVNYDTATRSNFIRLDKDGILLNTYRYGADDARYEVEDVFAHDGKVYISAQARPTDSRLYDNIDISDWENLDTEEYFRHYDDGVLEAAREEFSSVLFVCDPDKGSPELFYSVGGTMAGTLSEDEDGNLQWQVKRLIKCGYSPYTSSFSLYGLSREYDYTFDYDNDLLRQEKTDVIGGFSTH